MEMQDNTMIKKSRNQMTPAVKILKKLNKFAIKIVANADEDPCRL